MDRDHLAEVALAFAEATLNTLGPLDPRATEPQPWRTCPRCDDESRIPPAECRACGLTMCLFCVVAHDPHP